MEGILNRLSDLILKEIEKRKCSIKCFAELCGVRQEEMRLLVNKQKNDVRLSIMWKICENSEIRLSDIFEIECSEEFNLENYILTNGKEKYAIKKLGRGNKTSAF